MRRHARDVEARPTAGAPKRRRRAGLAGLTVSVLLAACTTSPRHACAPGETPAVSDVLVFGTAMPGGTVSPDDWADFLRATVTPRFPDGLSAWPVAGQWRSADGTIVKEGSYLLSLVHPEAQVHDEAVRAIADAYKARFRQEAVLRVRSRVCMSL